MLKYEFYAPEDADKKYPIVISVTDELVQHLKTLHGDAKEELQKILQKEASIEYQRQREIKKRY